MRVGAVDGSRAALPAPMVAGDLADDLVEPLGVQHEGEGESFCLIFDEHGGTGQQQFARSASNSE